jgi:murein DD-endopeptidase MepM/ murein hydrolase activator NlpD
LLPFEGTKNYTGGPHVSDDTSICAQKNLSAADGIDFAVLSISEGTLVAAEEWDGKTFGRGTYVEIRHDNGLISEYWHLSRLSDEIKVLKSKGPNQRVARGFPLGFAGDSGKQTSVHLHLRIVGAAWHGQSINDYQIWMHRRPGSDSHGFNYQGSATKGQTKDHDITLSASACKGAQATAKVGIGFAGKEERNGVDPNTLFAEDRIGVGFIIQHYDDIPRPCDIHTSDLKPEILLYIQAHLL